MTKLYQGKCYNWQILPGKLMKRSLHDIPQTGSQNLRLNFSWNQPASKHDNEGWGASLNRSSIVNVPEPQQYNDWVQVYTASSSQQTVPRNLNNGDMSHWPHETLCSYKFFTRLGKAITVKSEPVLWWNPNNLMPMVQCPFLSKKHTSWAVRRQCE